MEDSAATTSERTASRPMTIQRIAETLGIHKSTVSLTLSGKGRISAPMRARILSLAEELGYEPDLLAQRLANRSIGNVVCLCSASLDPGRATEKVVLLQTALVDMGMEVPIYTPSKSRSNEQESQAALFKQLRRQKPQAIVCSTHKLSAEGLAQLETYAREGGVLVCYDIPVPLSCDQVIFDREDNAYQGARHLLEQGHRKLGLGVSRLQRPLDDSSNAPQNLRLRGFRRALEEYGVPFREEWLFENQAFERGGAEMAQAFLTMKDRPTGLCIVNDYVALAFMAEVMRAGVRVPHDVSIVGHDDQLISLYCPVPLTSVSQPAEEIVHAVAQRTVARLQGDAQPPQTITLKGKLIPRDSVAPLHAVTSHPR